MKLGPSKPLPNTIEGVFGVDQPCWVVAIKLPGGPAHNPLAVLHCCDEAAARAMGVAVANALQQTSFILGRLVDCKHIQGAPFALISEPRLIERRPDPASAADLPN